MKLRLLLSQGLLGLTFACQISPSAAQPPGYFMSPILVPGLPLTGQFDFGQTLTADGLLMIFVSDGTLYETRRGSTSESFGTPVALGPTVNSSSGFEQGGSCTSDGLILVFERDPDAITPITSPEIDLFETRRANRNEPFGEATPMPTSIDDYSALTPWLSPDGLMLLYSSTRPGGQGNADIWVAIRSHLEEPFGTPTNFNDFFPGSQVNTAFEEVGPCLSSDGLVLFVADLYNPRPGGHGAPDIWVATRPHHRAPFSSLLNLNTMGLGSSMNGANWEGFVFISRDWPAPGSKLYFASNRRTEKFDFDYWEAEWVPFLIQQIRPTANGVQIDFTGKTGRSYDVQYRDNGEQVEWISLGMPITATSDANSLTAPYPPPGDVRTYRIVSP